MAASSPATTTARAGIAQPARSARSTSTSPSVPAASPAAVSATTRYADGCRPSDHGGPVRPGSTGSMTEGPATATAKVHVTLAPMAMSPVRPVFIPSDLTRSTGSARTGRLVIGVRRAPWPRR